MQELTKLKTILEGSGGVKHKSCTRFIAADILKVIAVVVQINLIG